MKDLLQPWAKEDETANHTMKTLGEALAEGSLIRLLENRNLREPCVDELASLFITEPQIQSTM